MKFSTKADVLLGLQWGDEGKGKIVDYLTPGYDIVARFQGGPNAGHTLEFENKKIVLHTIPSGIFRPNCTNIIGNGVVIDPFVFEKELQKAELPLPYLKQNLLISSGAHMILPSHRLLDAALECKKGKSKIGSTLKGIGPAYTDKISRDGMRISDISGNEFEKKYSTQKELHLKLVGAAGYKPEDFKIEGVSFAEYEKQWLLSLETLNQISVIDSVSYINQALDKGKKVLAEGAQGTLLDVDFGSYPFVTSSNTIAAGACTGLGLAPSRIGDVVGIFKAYCTRVGSGPFPTELFGTEGEEIRMAGGEFGATTGRPRRCGWLDLPALKFAVTINGISKLVITKADVLGAFSTIKVCTDYRFRGERVDFSTSAINLSEAEPQFMEIKGWKSNLENIESLNNLPVELLDYIKYIEDYVSTPVQIVSTGPGREQTIIRE
jgi:adenylosuccinate synthase